MTVKEARTISVGIGNITGEAMVDARGRAGSITGGTLKKLSVKYPKVDKATGLTVAGQKAQVSLTLQGTDLSAAGFDTEGVVNTGIPEKLAQPRKIQVALVMGGVSYYGQVDVSYTLSKNVGQIQGRSAR